MRCGGCPRIGCASISAGVAGTAPTSRTSRCATSSTSCSRWTARPTPSRRATCATSTSGRCGDVKLAEDKILIPGVVSHATNVVEHPELVADRIVRFAELVGRERVMAGTDCGLGGRIHADIAWAKLETLAQGAALASRRLA